MNTRRLLSNSLRPILIALLLVPWLLQVPLFGAIPQPAKTASLFLHRLPILSDFDADNKLDQATLFSDGPFKQIHIAFGKSSWSSLSFHSTRAERGGLFSGDVDHDGDIDLVWTAESGGESLTWFGDGRGNFSLDGSRKLDFDAFLLNSQSRIDDHPGGDEPQTVLLSTVVYLPGAFEYRPYLFVSTALHASLTPAAFSPFVAINSQRGPPASVF